MRGRLNALLSVAALVAAPTAVAQTQVDAVQADRDAKSLLEANPALEYDPTSVLVRFHDDTPEALRAELREMVGLGTRQAYRTVKGLELLDVRTGVKLAIELLEPHVDFVEPNWVQRKVQTPNDSYFSLQWGCHNTGQSIQGSVGVVDADIDAVEAWDIKTSAAGFAVADIDTGVDWDHPDLAANIWSNPGEIPGNGQDDDGNGYVDDVRGWDFYSNDSDPDDSDGHGSHTSGTVGAVGNNGVGVTGVAWQCEIVPIRFLGPQGGYTSDAILAVEYCTLNGIKVSNNSWGGGGFSSALYSAISASRSIGHVFVAAAGNSGTNNDASPHYPSNYDLDNVLSVAATDNRGRLASFSNYGSSSVDLAAPGVDIASTYASGGYVWSSGTSMATPHVTGVVVLLYDQNPGWTYSQVISRILSTVTPNSNLSGRCVTGGDLNAFAALNNGGGGGGGGGGGDTTPPAPPTGLSATAGDGVVDLDWANSMATDLAGYRVYRSTTSGSGYTAVSGLLSGSAFTDTGVSNGTTYHYVVTAEDTSGNESGASSEVSATPEAPGGGGGVEQQIFFGGFESADFGAEGWSTNGNTQVSTAADQGGTYGARISRTSWIEKAVSTAGHTAITLSYARRTRNFESNESLTVEYWNGSSWVTIESTRSTTWGTPTWSLPADAADNSAFRLRFRTNGNRNNERGDVDDVELRGTTL